MIYRGPGFLAVVGFSSSSTPSPPPPRERVVSLSQSSSESPAELTNGKGVGEESNRTTERKPSPL